MNCLTVIINKEIINNDQIKLFNYMLISRKRKIFNLVARESALVIGQHFVPFPSLGHVVKKGDGWLFQPIKK